VTVRVGFLGAGLIATYHSKMLRHSGEDVQWTGVFDPDADRAATFASATGATICPSEDAVLDGCDAVYICTWTSEHPRLVARAAERGIAVFCEKPLAVDAVSARAMADQVHSAGIVNQVGLVLRSSPAFLWMRELVSDPASGRLMNVIFRDDQYIPVQGMYSSTWRGDRTKAGAGALLEHSIHDIDMLEFVCGPIRSVGARTGEFHRLPGIEDTLASTIEFENGAVGSLASIWHDVLERPSLRRVEIFCERMWCALEGDWFGPVTWQRSGQAQASLESDALVEQVAALDVAPANPDGAFVRAVRDHTPAHPDFAVAVRAHDVVDAMYRSAADGGIPTAV
jgi:predicted dehydrogenase